ncbi:MAG TPA: prepilin-type N-terminal cleavage/methylation domain-containing protein, partial [Bacillota bacterium]|nr:prepilin-type N-terminal cleavage/methylation domain-containing protein [Bacillota bacterium]
RRASQCASSLMELLVAIAVGSIVLAAVMQTFVFSSRSFVALGNYNDLDKASRNTLDIMTRDIRQAKVFGGSYYSTNYMWFTNLNGSVFGYTWDPGAKTVSRLTADFNGTNLVNIQSNVLMKGCDLFSFRIWLRNPTNQFWFPYSANSQPNATKLVDVSWRCSRRVIAQFNTESVQTAKIVLRN